jgi:hypothetical protein
VTDAAAAAWLEVLGALIANAAHASNNVLNAAAVNVSVLASRLSSPKVAESSGEELAGRTAGFAAQAAAGIDALSELVQSMLALARPLPVKADPARMVTDIVRVATVDARQGGPKLDVELCDPMLPGDADAASAVRLGVAAGVVALHRGGQGGSVRWIARDVTLARPARPSGPALATPIVADNILRIVAGTGVAVHVEAEMVTFSIPEVTVAHESR